MEISILKVFLLNFYYVLKLKKSFEIEKILKHRIDMKKSSQPNFKGMYFECYFRFRPHIV